MSKTPSLKKFTRHRRYLATLQNSIELIRSRARVNMKSDQHGTPITASNVPLFSEPLQLQIHERSLMQGLYVSLALLLTCAVSAAAFGLCVVLDPFLRPLIWAVLCGAVLFPFKSSLTASAESWFAKANKSNRPFLVSLSIAPVNAFDRFAEALGSAVLGYGRYFVGGVLAIGVCQALGKLAPDNVGQLVATLSRIDSAVDVFISTCNDLVVRAAMVVYFSILCFLWTPTAKAQFRYGSIAVWPFLTAYISNALGFIWSPNVVFYALQILFFVGLANRALLILNHEKISGDKKNRSIVKAIQLAAFSSIQYPYPRNLDENDESSSPDDSAKLKHKKSKSESDAKPQRQLDSQKSQEVSEADPNPEFKSSKIDTDKYLYGAFYACVGIVLWKHKSISAILAIPMAYFCLKRIFFYFGIGEMMAKMLEKISRAALVWYLERRSALVPMPIRSLYDISMMIERRIARILRGSIDTVSTTLVICALIVLVIFTSIFITIQIYVEGMYLIQASVEFLNSTLMNSPEIDWIPQEWKDYTIGMLESAYLYGRTAISDVIRKLVKDLEPAKADHLEMKLVELWDRLYQTWVSADDEFDFIEPSVDLSTAVSAWESLKDSFEKSSLDLCSVTSIRNFIGENLGFFVSILDSVWCMLKGYMSLILSIVTELTCIIFMSGSFVLNFSVNTVVFFTTLFYLLNASRKVYKPIQLISDFSPVKCDKFIVAMQESVIGVFTTTFKLASFFGMWTWFVHNLFQVKIVYLPSFFATLLGAVPFLDAYFACIPAAIELWFSHGLFVAITFFLLHFLPCSIVVSEFYEEIERGGHPYLTGLSIAGGIFCFGIEGAIFGPLMLCCVMMVINLSRKYFQSPLVG